MPWRLALLAPAVLLLIAATVFVPWAREAREVVVATPQPPPRFDVTPVELGPGEDVCSRPVPITEESDFLRIRGLRIDGTPATKLQVTVQGIGYRARQTFEDYADFQVLMTPLPDPPEELPAELCVRNAGKVRGLIEGVTGRPAAGLMTASLNGRPTDVHPVLDLWSGRHRSYAGRRDEIVEAATTFRPGWVPEGALWGLAALVLLGVPACIALALRRSGPQA